jgi:hypothetical protein
MKTSFFQNLARSFVLTFLALILFGLSYYWISRESFNLWFLRLLIVYVAVKIFVHWAFRIKLDDSPSLFLGLGGISGFLLGVVASRLILGTGLSEYIN